MRTIAVLTSGGDAPGMNAAVRSVVRAADWNGARTFGVTGGFRGLISGDIAPLDARAVSGILHVGGTVLGTARSDAFRTPEGRRTALAHLTDHGIEGLVVVGGDGSFRGADALGREGDVGVVGIPGTIDNDLVGCDFTLGFDTAVNTALESIDKVRDTAASHGRLFFIEVMGRQSGWLALYSGLGGGASEVLVPERPFDPAGVRKRALDAFAMGKQFCLVIVAEGVGGGNVFELADDIAGGTDIDYRVVSLGHVQRGGAPSMRDRMLGALLGDAAVGALLSGATRVMVGQHHGEVVRTSLEEAWSGADRTPDQLLGLMDRLAR